MAAYNEGEEWLDQLLTYLEGNVKYVRDYCDKNIPEIKDVYKRQPEWRRNEDYR